MDRPLPYFLSKGFWGTPPSSDPCLQTGSVNPNFSGPIFNNHFFSFVAEPNVTSPVSCLLLNRTPFTILRLIVSIVVDSVKACAVRSFSHITQKVRVSTPAPAYFYAACTVPSILCGCFSKTSGSHGCPTYISGGFTVINSEPLPSFFHWFVKPLKTMGGQRAN